MYCPCFPHCPVRYVHDEVLSDVVLTKVRYHFLHAHFLSDRNVRISSPVCWWGYLYRYHWLAIITSHFPLSALQWCFVRFPCIWKHWKEDCSRSVPDSWHQKELLCLPVPNVEYKWFFCGVPVCRRTGSCPVSVDERFLFSLLVRILRVRPGGNPSIGWPDEAAGLHFAGYIPVGCASTGHWFY